MDQTKGLLSQGLTINSGAGGHVLLPLGAGHLEGVLSRFLLAAPSGSTRVQPPLSRFEDRSPEILHTFSPPWQMRVHVGVLWEPEP